MAGQSKRGPASVPAQPSEAWKAWEAAVRALRQHERECQACTVAFYCVAGGHLNAAEANAKWAVDHPGTAL